MTCLPEDFVNTIQYTPYSGPSAGNIYINTVLQTVNSKFFFPTATNMYISTEEGTTSYGLTHWIYPANAPSYNYIWEYWKDRIGTTSMLSFLGGNVNISNKSITGKSVTIITADAACWCRDLMYYAFHLVISGSGYITDGLATSSNFFLLSLHNRIIFFLV